MSVRSPLDIRTNVSWVVPLPWNYKLPYLYKRDSCFRIVVGFKEKMEVEFFA